MKQWRTVFSFQDTFIATPNALSMHFRQCADCGARFRASGKELRLVLRDVNKALDMLVERMVSVRGQQQMTAFLMTFVDGPELQRWACGDKECPQVCTQKPDAARHMVRSGHSRSGHAAPRSMSEAYNQIVQLSDVYQLRGIRATKLVCVGRLAAGFVARVRARVAEKRRQAAPVVAPRPALSALGNEVREQDEVGCLVATAWGVWCVGALTARRLAKRDMFVTGGPVRSHVEYTFSHGPATHSGRLWVEEAGRLDADLNNIVRLLAHAGDSIEARRAALKDLISGPEITLYGCPFENCMTVHLQKETVCAHVRAVHFRQPGEHPTITYAEANTLVIPIKHCYRVNNLRFGIVRYVSLARPHPVTIESVEALRRYQKITLPHQKQIQQQPRQRSNDEMSQPKRKAPNQLSLSATHFFLTERTKPRVTPLTVDNFTQADIDDGSFNKELKRIQKQIAKQLKK